MIMSPDEITQIKIGNNRIGIVGLKLVLAAVAEVSATQSDEDIGIELLKRLAKRNYIPESSKAEYGRAFLREFKKFTGRPIENSGPDGLEIKVLGPGLQSAGAGSDGRHGGNEPARRYRTRDRCA